MSGNLKRLVSQDLKRYKDHEFDLDLSYITPTLIGNPRLLILNASGLMLSYGFPC